MAIATEIKTPGATAHPSETPLAFQPPLAPQGTPVSSSGLAASITGGYRWALLALAAVILVAVVAWLAS